MKAIRQHPAPNRTLLATLASSMITIAGVVFSITIVALSLASSQYTPRILRNFMGDRVNQAVLGTFVAIFAYCLVMMRTIRGAVVTYGSAPFRRRFRATANGSPVSKRRHESSARSITPASRASTV